MDFTEIYKQTGGIVEFSPGAHFLLTAVQDRLIVRHTETFQITRTWQVDATPSPTVTITAKPGRPPASRSWITHAGWSCDSEYLMAACVKLGVVNVFKLRDEEWSARIEAGAEGLARAMWAPDGRHVLCFSEWSLRVTVWSLVTGTATHIQYPIHPDRGYAFREDGRYFVLAERHKSRETLGIYDAEDSYKLVRHFTLPTASMSSLSISPTGNHVAVWEGSLEYKLCILTLSGSLLASFSPEPDPGLGIRTVAWHPSGKFLAVGGWDDKIHILDHLSWSAVATLELHARVSSSVAIWREPLNWLEATQGRGFLSYDRLRGSHTLAPIRPDPTKPNPKSGLVQLEWNQTGTRLLARFDSTPHVIHLYNFPSPSELFQPSLRSILIHHLPVLSAHWNPVRKDNFMACCGNKAVYIWSDEWVGDRDEGEEMAECIGVPTKQLDAKEIMWAPDGKGAVLLDKDTFCCAFEVEDEGASATS